jgi:hypothetical protein
MGAALVRERLELAQEGARRGRHATEIAAAVAAFGYSFGDWKLRYICRWVGTPRGQREGQRCT